MLYQIYCDESRQTSDRYMVLGGVIIPARRIDVFNRTMQAYREKERMHAELKWTKVSRGKLSEYKRFIDYFFALNNTDKLHFHSIIIDNHRVDHRRFSSGNRELGFYKFYYQLLLHSFGRRYYRAEGDTEFQVFLDERNSSYSLQTLKDVLNNGMRKKFDIGTRPFRLVEPRDSKQCDILQLNDIVVGAIGFQKNGYHLLAGANPAKVELADYIARQAGLADLRFNSPFGLRRFRIWIFRLRI